MRIALGLLALVLLTGCWVGDELDKSMEIANSVGKRKVPAESADGSPEAAAGEAEPAPVPAGAKPGKSLVDEIREWATPKPAPTPPDPADAPVRCTIGSRQLFSTRLDCEARGGRAVELPPRRP
jgi:hypothetical protein